MVIREIRLTVTVEESIQHHTLGNGVLYDLGILALWPSIQGNNRIPRINW